MPVGAAGGVITGGPAEGMQITNETNNKQRVIQTRPAAEGDQAPASLLWEVEWGQPITS